MQNVEVKQQVAQLFHFPEGNKPSMRAHVSHFNTPGNQVFMLTNHHYQLMLAVSSLSQSFR